MNPDVQHSVFSTLQKFKPLTNLITATETYNLLAIIPVMLRRRNLSQYPAEDIHPTHDNDLPGKNDSG